jgi:hypothetical protein
VQVVLGGTVLYIIFSFFDWQQVSASAIGFKYGIDEWHGIGVIAGLLAFALLLWEAARLFGVQVPLGSLTPGLVSAALALLLLVFTLITFISHNEARHWPAWIGLLLSIVIAAAAFVRAKAEGVEMPDLSAMTRQTAGGSGSAQTPAASPPAASPEPEGPPATGGEPQAG